MAHDVFISHSAKDKEVANAVCHRLEEAGIRCWIAPRDVQAGQAWDDAIVEALVATKLVVLVFSAAANESRAVRNEIASALDGNKIVFPFRIENILPSGGLQFHLSRVHWLDAMTPPLDSHIDNLVANAKRQLGHAPLDQPTRGPAPTPPRPSVASPPRRNMATLLIGGLGGVALLASVALVGNNWLQKREPALESRLPESRTATNLPAAAAPPAPTPAAPAPSDSAAAGMIFPDSATRMLVQSDLVGLSCGQLDVARNEIFARRGRYFQRADLQAYFQKFPWYHPATWNPELNPAEQANIALIGVVESQAHCH